MTQSASSSRLTDILPELESEIPNQLNRDQELEEVKELTATEVTFSLLCNSSLFGAPLYTFYQSTDNVDEYIKYRNQVTEWLKAVRIDLVQPRFEYKIKQLHRLYKSINALRDNATQSTTFSWFFDALRDEYDKSTSQRIADFQRCKDSNEYSRTMGKRISDLDVQTLPHESSKSLKGTYWKELIKVSDSIRRKRKNQIFLVLLLAPIPHSIMADAAIATPSVSMATLLTDDEKDFLSEQLGYDQRSQFLSNLTKDERTIMNNLSPSRFRPDASLGYRSYHFKGNVTQLDWIDTKVSSSLLRSLDHSESNELPELHPVEDVPLDEDEELTRSDDNSDNDSNYEGSTLSTIPSSPPPQARRLSIVASTSKPEPADTSRLGIRAREQAFLLQKKKEKATQPMEPKGSTGKGKQTHLPVHQPTTTNLSKLDQEEDGAVVFRISSDGCPRILRFLINAYKHRDAEKALHYQFQATPGAHSDRFNMSEAIAQQIPYSELQPGDLVLGICLSPYSVKYVVTFDAELKTVLFNRVNHHLWNRWS